MTTSRILYSKSFCPALAVLSIGQWAVNGQPRFETAGEADLHTPTQMNRLSLFVAMGCIVLAMGCEHQRKTQIPIIQAQFAASSDRGCVTLSNEELANSFDRMVIQVDTGTGFETFKTLQTAPLPDQDILLEEVPVETAAMRFIGCSMGQPRWVARSDVNVSESQKTKLTLRFGEPGAVNCFDLKDTDDVEFRTDWAWPSFLAGSMTLPDSADVLLLGGAQTYNSDEKRYAGTASSGWDVIGIDEHIYYDGFSRNQRFRRRDIGTVRIGPSIIKVDDGDRTGALLIGGAEAVRRNFSYKYGPLEPGLVENGQFQARCDPSRAPTFLDLSNGLLGAVSNPDNFVPRVLPAVASQGTETVIVGGLACQNGAYEPSDLIEVFDGTRIRTGQLDSPIFGATLTPLGPNRYLVWGYNARFQNSAPGWIIETGDTIRAVPFSLVNVRRDAQCGQYPPECVGWTETAYHAASRLPDRTDGHKQILISGGLSGTRMGADYRLVSSPGFSGSTCPANLFILAIGPDNRGDATPICIDADSPSAARAFHTSNTIGRGALIAGGWVLAEETNTYCSTDNDCAGGLCLAFRCTASMPNPSIMYDSNRWFAIDQVGRLAGHGRLAVGRFGHISRTTQSNSVIISGGSQSGSMANSTEYYLPPLPASICAAGLPSVNTSNPAE
ncbi:MAG: hypothetical protein CMH52_09655 [Myxococcales bacterium]|nr:hypothetical protein [Myxococcales bacterium]